jgi:hypothetical protein
VAAGGSRSEGMEARGRRGSGGLAGTRWRKLKSSSHSNNLHTKHEDDFKWKNFELQSCTRRKLQFSYKVYLHPSLNKKVINFLKQTVHLPPWATTVSVSTPARGTVATTVGHGGRNPATAPHCGRCVVLKIFWPTIYFCKKRGKNVKKKVRVHASAERVL